MSVGHDDPHGDGGVAGCSPQSARAPPLVGVAGAAALRLPAATMPRPCGASIGGVANRPSATPPPLMMIVLMMMGVLMLMVDDC